MVQDTLTIPYLFTSPENHPFEEVEWESRHARIVGEGGAIVFEAEGVEFPAFWSEQASNIVASKYFRVRGGAREYSVKQMIGRVSSQIAGWGFADGYFDKETAQAFWYELTHILLNQYASFNSPVWFNVGVEETPQCSACYILAVEDSMESILEWYHTEGMIFKGGSGAGVNLSNIRAEHAPLSSGGKASGPVSFMRGADTNAGIIKSAGSTRRAAKKVILNVDHPDIDKFIQCKVKAEAMARALIAAGYQDGLEAEVRETIPFQNANNDVSVSDLFLQSLSTDTFPGELHTKNIMHSIAQANWECGDPNLFFTDTVNAWHTCPNSGRISSSNPCGEFLFLDDSACNLASINLLKFLKSDGSFDVPAFKHTVDILITAQDILVDRSSYPTKKIEKHSKDFRPLGLGYANLGALLMAKGLSYDSQEGRGLARWVTALMTGEAYAQSAKLAERKGSFAEYSANREAMCSVMLKHMQAVDDTRPEFCSNADSFVDVRTLFNTWQDATSLGMFYGFRNAQVTLLAPTGTISFMMDCDTTGIEPDTALVKYKKLVGGGTLKMINKVVPRALETLGYTEEDVKDICAHIYEGGKLVECAQLEPEDYAVFDCAFPQYAGGRSLPWQSHIAMVAAVQPFLSGGVSKTVNMPNEATAQDIEQAFALAWKSGLKSVAIYRDGCKAVQPVTTQREPDKASDILRENIHEDFLECAVCSALPGADGLCTVCRHNRRVIADYKALVRTLAPHVVALSTPRDNSAAIAMLQELDKLPPPQETYEDFPRLGSSTPTRTRLPDERPAITHKFNIGGHEGYLTVGLYPDSGKPGELFVHMAKEGSTVSGLMDTVGILTSLLLQHGVPLEVLTEKLKAVRFEPSGFTKNPVIHFATSPVDYIFRWLEHKYGKQEVEAPEVHTQTPVPVYAQEETYTTRTVPFTVPAALNGHASLLSVVTALDALTCAECGSLMYQRAGSCYVCTSCGASSGCS